MKSSFLPVLLRGALLIAAALLLGNISSTARANTMVFSQPPNPAGGHYKSAWYAPDGLDGDEYTFDSFTIASGAAISEIRWRGCYTNYLSGAGRSPVYAFTISIYRSIPAGSQPDLGTGGRLARYNISGNAGETVVGTFGGVIMYDYAYSLPAPFQAAAGTPYWVQIEASQGVTPTYSWPPDWSMAAGTGGNNSHFTRITGGPYLAPAGDLAFSLYSSSAPTIAIAASESPAGSGSIAGAGSYPVNSTVILDATPNTGWGFANWIENGTTVSNNSHYSFSATTNRTLVANFVPAYTIITSAYPVYGGTITGAGVYNSGSTVTLVATPNHGFVFSGWSDGATTPTHSFIAGYDLQITAFFDSAPLSVTFDFDNARQYAPFPIDLSVSGLSAHFSDTGQGYSIQAVGTVGIAPAGFSGLCVFPSSVYASDLIVDFSETLVDFSILYSTQELGCDSSATMRATAFMNGVQVGTNTTTAPVPGTWPSGTLTIAVPIGFNRVVVHYDARPPTCQDYGVIFLADNVTVTRLCVAPAVVAPPASTSACINGATYFAVTATGTSLGYQWQEETPTGSNIFTDLADGYIPGLGLVTGSSLPSLSLSQLIALDQHHFRCVVSNVCGSVASTHGTLTVVQCACDAADIVSIGGLPPPDGLLTGDDFNAFIGAFAAGDALADIVSIGGLPPPDGLITGDDFNAFIAAFASGCP